MSRLVVLKLGGSVITKKDADLREVDGKNLMRLSSEIASAKKEKNFQLVIVHGAGPFGHVPAKEYELDRGLVSEKQLRGFSITHSSMEELNSAVVGSLIASGVNAIAYQPSAAGILRNRKLTYFPTTVLKKLLKAGMVPVAHGDVLIDEATGVNILSGDHLVPYLARKLHAKRIILATDVDGVYDSDPKEGKSARLIREITSENIGSLKVGASKATDVTGGMKRKLDELLELAADGIESEIVSAKKPDVLRRALLGERGLGTLIRR
jgi:isopentenyl phosphate kinase